MAARTAKIEYYWSPVREFALDGSGCYTNHVVNWRLVGGNGEVMCQSTQGFQDKHDARRSVRGVLYRLAYGCEDDGTQTIGAREVGPGRKPT